MDVTLTVDAFEELRLKASVFDKIVAELLREDGPKNTDADMRGFGRWVDHLVADVHIELGS